MLNAHRCIVGTFATHVPTKETTPNAQLQFFVLFDNFISIAGILKTSAHRQKF